VILRECWNHWLRRYGESFRVGVQFYRGLFFQPPTGLLRWLFSPEAFGRVAASAVDGRRRAFC
jgi:hypothetical protein